MNSIKLLQVEITIILPGKIQEFLIGGPDHRRVPKKHCIFEYPWNLVLKWQNARAFY